MNNLFVVTFRQHDSDMCAGAHISSVVYISADKEKAVEFCLNNLDIEDKNENHWWFAIHEHPIDNGKQNNIRLVKIIDWNGKELKKHPIMGYETV